MCKKRKIITITVLFVLGLAVSYLQWGREIDVAGSMGTSSENFHEEYVTFTLNRLIITDKKSVQRKSSKNAGRMILLLLCSAMMWQSQTLYMVRCTVPVFPGKDKSRCFIFDIRRQKTCSVHTTLLMIQKRSRW